MAKLSVYDPPMCCSTGVCGPDADDRLAKFAAALDWAKRNGAEVERYNLGHQPGAFAGNPMVKGLLDTDGMACLPLVLLDGKIMAKGDYPSLEAIGAHLAMDAGSDRVADAQQERTAGEPCCGQAPTTTATTAPASACCTPAQTAGTKAAT